MRRGSRISTWCAGGPCSTTLTGPPGHFFAVLRSPTSSLGLASLDPNTDGETIDNGQHFMLPVELHPGEYLTTPLNAPFAFVYNRNHQPIAQIPLTLASDLPNMHRKVQFSVQCKFEPLEKGKSTSAILNLFYSEILPKPPRK